MNIDKEATRALKWAGTFKLLGQLFTWAITILVIRLLAPADYGLLALTMIVISLSTALAELGMGASLVQSNKLDPKELSRVAGLVWCLNLGMGLIVFAAAPLFSWAFDEPRLTNLIRVASLQFPLLAYVSIPQALAARDLDFRKLSLIEFASTIFSSLTTVVLAWRGFGVWSLLAGNLLGLLLRGLMMNMQTRRVRIEFSLSGMKKHLRFGIHMTMSHLIWQFASQADVIIGGRLLTREALGVYSLAYHLATLPMQKIMSIINQVAFSALARMQDDMPRLRSRVLLACTLLTVVSLPLLWGMSAVAAELVPLLLGQHWQQAAMPLQTIALVVPLRMISTMMNTAVSSLGQSGVTLRNTMVTAIVWPAGFLVGAQWGSVGLAFAWIVVTPITFIHNFASSQRVIGIAWRDLAKAVRIPFLAGLTMYATILALRLTIDSLDLLPRLLLLIAAGACVYLAFIGLFGRDVVRDLKSLLTAMRTKSPD